MFGYYLSLFIIFVPVLLVGKIIEEVFGYFYVLFDKRRAVKEGRAYFFDPRGSGKIEIIPVQLFKQGKLKIKKGENNE